MVTSPAIQYICAVWKLMSVPKYHIADSGCAAEDSSSGSVNHTTESERSPTGEQVVIIK